MPYLVMNGVTMIAVIPAYEPDDKLVGLVKSFIERTDYQIVIVDDGSSEDKQPIFSKLETMGGRVKLIHHNVNRGKGQAMKTAFEWIRSQNFSNEGIVTVDADGQHLISDVENVSKEWSEHRDALVLGSRAFKGDVPLRSRVGNTITRGVFAISTGVKVYDTQTGLRAFSTDLLDEMLSIKGERYEYEINQLLVCTKKHIPIHEVTIETVYLNKNETSHFNTLKDSWRIYKMIFGFIASSFISWVVDYVLLLVLSSIFMSHAVDGTISLLGLALEPKLPALIIARIVSSALNYVLNRKVVFESKSRSSVWRYYILVAIMLAFNYGLLAIMTLVIPTWLAQIIAQLIIYPINFVCQRKFVFKEKR